MEALLRELEVLPFGGHAQGQTKRQDCLGWTLNEAFGLDLLRESVEGTVVFHILGLL